MGSVTLHAGLLLLLSLWVPTARAVSIEETMKMPIFRLDFYKKQHPSLWVSWQEGQPVASSVFEAIIQQFQQNGLEASAVNRMSADDDCEAGQAALIAQAKAHVVANPVNNPGGGRNQPTPNKRMVVVLPCSTNANSTALFQDAIDAGLIPLFITASGSEHPPGLTGLWAAFAPDLFHAGYLQGQAACQLKSGTFAYVKDRGQLSAVCDMMMGGFTKALTECNHTGKLHLHQPAISSLLWQTVSPRQVATGKDAKFMTAANTEQAVISALVHNPTISGVAACHDLFALGAMLFWQV